MSKGSDTRMWSDAEQVAALLDGKLSIDGRRALLARLADDPMWRDVLVSAAEVMDTTAVSRDEAAQGAAAAAADVHDVSGVRLLTSPHKTLNRWRWTWMAAAAMVGVIGFSFWTSSQLSVTHPAALTLALAEPPAVGAFGADTFGITPALSQWTRVRAATRVLPSRALSVRLGALAAASLQAMRAGNEGNLRAHREDMRALLAQVPASSPVVAALDSTSSVEGLRNVFDTVRALVVEEAFDVGVILALAHVRSDVASDRLTTLLAADSANDPEVARLITRLHETGSINAPASSAATVAALDSLLVRLGR